MRILLVEDDAKLAAILKTGLEEALYTVDHSACGSEGLVMAKTYRYDAIILDQMLPILSGTELLETLRKSGNRVPVLFLTALSDVDHRIRALNLGADDYLGKPFDFDELVARINALIRRSKGEASPIIAIADLTINTQSKQISRAGRQVKLSAREYCILEYLCLNINRVISRDEFLAQLYDFEENCESNVIDVYINFLRKKIDRGFDKPLIHTVRGMGYVLRAEP